MKLCSRLISFRGQVKVSDCSFPLQNVSKVFDLRAVQMVDPAQRAKHGVVTDDNRPGFVAVSGWMDGWMDELMNE